MHDNLLNILSDNNKDIDNQKLMDYITGKLSEEHKHEVERWMAENPMINEAVEGLQQAGTERSSQAIEQINKQLRLHLQQRKRKRISKTLPVHFWTYIAVAVILMIAVLVFLVIVVKR